MPFVNNVQIQHWISAAHRLPKHKGLCRFVHGHNYLIKVVLQSYHPETLTDGMVVDFGPAKKLIRGWLDENWDHALLYWEQDKELEALLQTPEGLDIMERHYPFHEQPTAEVMAGYLMEKVVPYLLDPLPCLPVEVSVQETEGCIATFKYGIDVAEL